MIALSLFASYFLMVILSYLLLKKDKKKKGKRDRKKLQKIVKILSKITIVGRAIAK